VLQPATGGIFIVAIEWPAKDDSAAAAPAEPRFDGRILWDRARDEGFPETKELKRRVRDVIDPGRDLGHVDRNHRAEKGAAADGGPQEGEHAAGQVGKGADTAAAPAACAPGDAGCKDCE
jgi:predicted Rdx family selenoprotein